MTNHDPIAEMLEIQARLESLSPPPAIDRNAMLVRRRAFMTKAAQYHRATQQQPTVRKVIQRLLSPARPMMIAVRAMMVVILATLITFGIANTARASLPDSPLYGLKLALESAQLGMTFDPAQRMQLDLTIAEERVREFEYISLSEQQTQASLQRLEAQMARVLDDVAKVQPDQKEHAMMQVREMITRSRLSLNQANGETSTQKRASFMEALQIVVRTETQLDTRHDDNEHKAQGAGSPPMAENTPTASPTGTPAITDVWETATPFVDHNPTTLNLSATPYQNQQNQKSTATPVAVAASPVPPRATQPSSMTPVRTPQSIQSPQATPAATAGSGAGQQSTAVPKPKQVTPAPAATPGAGNGGHK